MEYKNKLQQHCTAVYKTGIFCSENFNSKVIKPVSIWGFYSLYNAKKIIPNSGIIKR